jgi:hypothetical protein
MKVAAIPNGRPDRWLSIPHSLPRFAPGFLSSLGTPHLLWLQDYPDPILIDDGRFRRRTDVHAASVSVADDPKANMTARCDAGL